MTSPRTSLLGPTKKGNSLAASNLSSSANSLSNSAKMSKFQQEKLARLLSIQEFKLSQYKTTSENNTNDKNYKRKSVRSSIEEEEEEYNGNIKTNKDKPTNNIDTKSKDSPFDRYLRGYEKPTNNSNTDSQIPPTNNLRNSGTNNLRSSGTNLQTSNLQRDIPINSNLGTRGDVSKRDSLDVSSGTDIFSLKAVVTNSIVADLSSLSDEEQDLVSIYFFSILLLFFL